MAPWIKTTIIAIGAAKRTIAYQEFIRKSFNLSSWISMDLEKWKPANNEINNAPNGNPILLVRKSAKSKIDMPRMKTSDNTPKDKALGIPTKKIRNPETKDARFLLSYLDLIPIDTTISNILMEEVSVANNRRIKNKIKKNGPNII